MAARSRRTPRPKDDPFLARLGLMGLGFLLLAPIAMILRGGDDGTTLTTSGLPGATAILEVGAAPADSAASSVAPAPLVPPEQAAALAAQAAAATTPETFPASPVATAAPVATAPAAAATPAATQAPVVTAPPIAPPAEPVTHSSGVDIAPLAEVVEAAPVSIAARVAESPDCPNSYDVQAGDYWVGIAKTYKVSLDEILTANDAGATTAIYPGDEVCLPASATAPAERPASTQAAPATTKAPTATTKAPTATTKAPTATTKAPATTEAPATTQPKRDYSADEVREIIRAVWPDDLEEKALVIADRESGYNPYAKNYCCYGLFQLYWDVHKSWMKAAGIGSASELYDPQVNAYAAYLLYQRNGGWGPWSQTNG